MSRRRPVSLNECTSIRESVSERVDPDAKSVTARRRNRLRTGATRWVRDVCADRRPFQRVLLVALTMKDVDPELAQGAIQRTFEDLKDLHAAGVRGAQSRGRGVQREQLVGAGLAARAAADGLPLNRPIRGSAQTAVSRSESPLSHDRSAVSQTKSPKLPAEPVGNLGQRGLHLVEPVNRILQDCRSVEESSLQPLRLGGLGRGAVVVGPGPQVMPDSGDMANVLPAGESVRHATILTDKRQPVQDKRMRYLWWAEFQKRGALHYHAVIVDAPFADLAAARHWFDAHWRAADGAQLAEIQTWVTWKSAAWFKSAGGDYVLKDVRKLNGKRYEQDYSRMPRGWRTFRHHQLTFVAAEHKQHEHQVQTVCTAAPDSGWGERRLEIWIYRRDTHVPAHDGCRLYQRRSRRGRQPVVSQNVKSSTGPAAGVSPGFPRVADREKPGDSTRDLTPSPPGKGAAPDNDSHYLDLYQPQQARLALPAAARASSGQRSQETTRTPRAEAWTAEALRVRREGRVCHPTA